MKTLFARKYTRSVRKHIRRQKALIRRAVADPDLRKKRMAELLAKFGAGPAA